MKSDTQYIQTEFGEIPDNWEIKKIDDVFDVSAGGDLARLNFSKVKDSKFKYPIYSNTLNNNGLYGFSDKYQFEPECITITARGEVGTAEYRNKPFNAIVRLLVLKPKIKVSCYFVSNFINSGLNFQYVGSAVNQLTAPMIRQRNIVLPPIDEQQQIASVLSSLDDKIELNRRMNKTLEEIGKALFKRWFVDFEFPNENGEPYKSSGGEMVESELGEIPKGWKVKSLFELANYINGKAFKNKDFSNEGLPIIKIAELKNGVSNSTNKSDHEFDEKYLLKNKDILFSWSGSPDTSIDCFIWFSGSGWLNQHIFKVVPKSGLSYGFVYFLLKYFMSRFISIAHNKKTTGLGHVTVSDLKRIKTALPNEINFDKLLDNLFENIYGNLREIQTLEGARDSLLPRLMSGKIRVTV